MSKTTICEVCKVIKGSTGITKAVPGKYPLVTTSAERLSHNKFQFDCEAVCVPLVSSTGHGHASMHRLHHQKGNFALGSILAAIIPKDKRVVDTKFLYIYLSLMKDRVFVPLMKGTANISLSVKAIKSAKIELPTIDRQRQIARLYDRATPLLYSLREVFESQKRLASDLRCSILEQAVCGKLVPQDPNDEPASVLLEKIKAEKQKLIKQGKIRKQKPLPPIKPDEIPYKLPKEWIWVRFADFGDWGAGSTPNRGTPEYYGGNTPWFKSGELKGGIITESEEQITSKALKYCSLRLDQPGDVLIAMYGATIGKVAILGVEATTNQAVCACTCYNGIFNRYLLLLLKAFKSYFIGKSAGGAQPNFSKIKIVLTPAPLPSFNEQHRIVAKVDNLMILCDELEEKLKQSEAESEKLMESVVHHLLHQPLPEEQAITDEKQSRTPYKDDAAIVCFLLSEMEKLHRPTTEFFIQKHIFVIKHHLHLPVNSLFVRKVAGPWSHELKRKAIFASIKMNWLRWEKSRLVAGSTFEKALNHASTVLGEAAAQITQLVEDLKAFGNNGLERWTTVLKVVEDLKEKQQPITRSNIQHEIDNWRDKRLKAIFAEESVDYTIAMMLKHNWLPPLPGQ